MHLVSVSRTFEKLILGLVCLFEAHHPSGKMKEIIETSFKLTFISSFCWKLSFLGPSSSLEIYPEVVNSSHEPLFYILISTHKQNDIVWIFKFQNNMAKL